MTPPIVCNPLKTSLENRTVDLESVFAFVLVLVALGLYFLPTMISGARDHHNFGAIFALNLLLGWTLFGWILSLVWSLTATGLRTR